MQQSLVLLVSHAELLQEQMSVPDDLLHLHVALQTHSNVMMDEYVTKYEAPSELCLNKTGELLSFSLGVNFKSKASKCDIYGLK